jgi:hypothetical protein
MVRAKESVVLVAVVLVLVTLMVAVSALSPWVAGLGLAAMETPTVGVAGGELKVPRSKRLYSRNLSCAVMAPAVHSLGNIVPPKEPFSTWYSL